MATRIRLQRHGKKGKPFFHIVVADERSKRDGRFIEKLGTYNPNTNPATIDLNFDRSLHWVGVGAQPSDTARAILSYKGVLMKDHLLRGVQKGAFTQEQAEAKFEKWLDEKYGKIESKKTGLSKAREEEERARLAAEREVNAARAARQSEAATAAEVVEAEEAPVEETPAEEASAEAEGTTPAVEENVEATEEKKEE